MYELKILLLDIETAPSKGWFFDAKKEYNILRVDQEWFIMSFAYKWYGQKQIHVHALPDYPLYKHNHTDDHALMKTLHKLFSEADVIVGHNGDNFDIKRVNSRLMFHRFAPPEPYKTADTLKMARRLQSGNSNRLDDLARYYGIGEKLPHRGTNTWLGCVHGDPKEWRILKKYNAHDVHLLEGIYTLFRGWDNRHPNVNVVSGKQGSCPKCGSSRLQRRGYSLTRTTESPRYQCMECGGWSTGQPQRLAARIHIR